MFDHIYVGDFENTTGGNSTYVYGAGFMELTDNDVTIFENIDDAMNYLSQLPARSCVYFHNLATYDAHIIIYWLLQHGYVCTEDKNVRKRFNGIITDDRQVYQLKIRFRNHYVEFRDTCKLVQGKLDYVGKTLGCPTSKLIGTIDYDKPRGDGYVMDDVEREYLKHDVLLLKEIVQQIQQMGGLSNFITAGGFAFYEMKKSLYKTLHRKTDDEMKELEMHPKFKQYIQNTYRTMFPEMPFKYDEMIRHAYRGGYCINWSDGEIYTGHGLVLDFNSLYPSVLCDVNDPKMYPYGDPRYFKGNVLPTCDCFIVHISTRFILKNGCLPFIQLKGSPFFAQNEYIRETDEEVDLWLCSVDYKLFHDMYDVLYEEIIEGFEFSSYDHFFDDFVLSHYDMKKNAPNKVIRQTAKIILNSAYGKFGTRIKRASGIPYINDDGTVSLQAVYNDDFPQATYIPVAVFCTAYAREKTIRSALKVIDHLRYIDTDSLHLVDITLDEVKQIFDIDPVELGYLACESEFDMARWVRQKTYIERNIIEDGKTLTEPKISVKACGLTDEGKDILKQDDDIWMKFTYGLTIKECKLMKHTVVGGVNLIRRDFAIRG